MNNGILAHRITGRILELRVLKSAAGYYIGTMDENGPVSRESVEYYSNQVKAVKALVTKSFTQRWNP